jgi:predicted nucleic acid-binding protein
MMQRVLLDTGPLVAMLNKHDPFYAWAKLQIDEISPPMFACEGVLTEACFLLRRIPGGSENVMGLIEKGVIATPFRLAEHAAAVSSLMAKYSNIPMSLADACLVRMSEIYDDRAVLTFDSDFKLYRKHGRQVIPTLIPAARR